MVFASVWGLLPLDHWWVRGVDFPRIQILVIGLVSLVGLLVLAPQWKADVVLLLALIGGRLQLRSGLALYPIVEKEVRQALPIPDAADKINGIERIDAQ